MSNGRTEIVVEIKLSNGFLMGFGVVVENVDNCGDVIGTHPSDMCSLFLLSVGGVKCKPNKKIWKTENVCNKLCIINSEKCMQTQMKLECKRIW